MAVPGALVLTHLAAEQDAALSVYSAGEAYVSSSPNAAAVVNAVYASVLDGEQASATDAPLRAAGAPEREADPTQHIATVSLPVVTTESDTADSDGVEHHRQSRLTRWQAQR